MNYPFTVKIMEFHGGESVLPALAVEALPQNPDQISKHEEPIKSILLHQADGEPPHEVYSGRVFVMNEIGKTVARYTLGGTA